MDKINKNDAENLSLQIQKIIKEEIDTLRELLSFLSLDDGMRETIHTDSKKTFLRQRSELFKKLRQIKKEKESFFENFFFNQLDDLDVSILKDHLTAIKSEIDRKQSSAKRSSDHSSFLVKAHLKKQQKPKSSVTTLESIDEGLN